MVATGRRRKDLDHVGKLGGTIEYTEEKQIGNVSMREMKEGRNLPTLFSSPSIKIRVFNWSKLI
jgi:hypothetical protein